MEVELVFAEEKAVQEEVGAEPALEALASVVALEVKAVVPEGVCMEEAMALGEVVGLVLVLCSLLSTTPPPPLQQ